MGVYAAMSVTGGVVGLIAGGLLSTYASWRWVLFVNVPIGVAAAVTAPPTALLGPVLVAGTGLGMLFMPLSVVALSRVQPAIAGAASSLLNTGQQIR